MGRCRVTVLFGPYTLPSHGVGSDASVLRAQAFLAALVCDSEAGSGEAWRVPWLARS